MPAPGKFILHSHVIPDLPAGPYTLRVRQEIDAPGAHVDGLDSHFEVTAPRFVLPADQILSTFPPNQAQGAFSSRLPQVVLRRRTLPWERDIGGTRDTPWLALVLLADAEAEFHTARPIAECVTDGVSVAGRTDATVANAITVTQRVVDEVFPAVEDLPLLTHVREVDLDDTELALGDDDGWLAVVMTNRLPQPGTRYRACLISLEGQLDVLPTDPEVADESSGIFVYPDFALRADAIATAAQEHAGGTARSVVVHDSWSGASGPAGLGTPGLQAASRAGAKIVEEQAPVAKTRHLLGDIHAFGLEFVDAISPRFTFPVLAHWTFACTDGGDFQSLMQDLDVGMLGTLPGPRESSGRKPAPPPRRPQPPEVLDTGHIALAHRTRLGEPGTVWYRGPLVPRPVSRQEPGPDGRLPLLHASDHARRVGPDGRENLGLATGFEIGRLLALAEPSVVAALLQWRKAGFEVARRSTLLEGGFAGLLEVAGVDAGFAAHAGNALISALGADDAVALGPLRPLIDPGLPVEELDDVDAVELLAAGLAVDPLVLRDLADPRAAARAGTVEAVTPERIEDFDRLAAVAQAELAALRDGVVAAAQDVFHDAFGEGR